MLKYHISAIPAEAMATGRCILMSREMHEKGLYKHFKDEEELFVVKSDRVDRIKDILENLIVNPDKAYVIGENGYKAIKEYDQFNENLDKTIKLYESLAD